MKPSTPSSGPKSPPKPARSTTSWTIPKPTDVLAYVYLWAEEAALGRADGVKERPVVVFNVRSHAGGVVEVFVAPVTTQPPRGESRAVEMPAGVREHLSLGDARCWIVATELNGFIWPGPDVRPIRRGDDIGPYYGKVPGRLLETVRTVMRTHAQDGRLGITKRSD